ncbi:hypothetical protein HYPSUDRAFT_36060 [Hypholoma sublateritium FD-334 SS-4]|uniref:Uncharacterized protein n=1 Tax=Hypholoma sublateritium (strain FD-334 SS-4) TaxID=945553 RepID=A0A0D2LGY3_HYPSF|nr:hypothetical protein HYPSUDRAFT_36060 [Hypholoma sublateritium FD-334 SS-4]
MSDHERFVDLKSIVEEHSDGDLAIDNPLRHKNLVDLVLQSLTHAKSASAQVPDLDQIITLFQASQQQVAKIDWQGLAEELQRSKPKPEDLGELNDVIPRSIRFISTHDKLGVEKNTSTVRYHLHNLSHCLHRRYLLTEDQESNEQSILYIKRAISLTEESGGEELADRLADLATSLSSRFEQTKQLSDLDEAVSAVRQSVSLTPPGDAHLQSRSNRFGEVLWRRFEVTGSTKDLEDAIQAQIVGSPAGQ